MTPIDSIRHLLQDLYGPQKGGEAFERLLRLLDTHHLKREDQPAPLSQRDIILITYADSLVDSAATPLETMRAFAAGFLKESFSAIHLLPFFPFSSDDGFSVIDYHAVDPDKGTWRDIELLGMDFGLMFDAVLNHVSSRSSWFEAYLAEEPGYVDLAIEIDPATDLSRVTRPRALPLLTPYTKRSGEIVHVWTTFSDDQIDLNYMSLDVLLKMIEVLLFYVEKGARFIRLDAVAYLWKEVGTACIHLPQTHNVIRLLRCILDWVAPGVKIITETNVPHEENISYFGNGRDEAQLVYNFSLPPLLLHTLATGDSRVFCQWVQDLATPAEGNAFLNFTASHDGIGIRPLEGLLPEDQIERLLALATQNGGRVSYKRNVDGSQSPYELNVTYMDALAPQGQGGSRFHARRFLASQAIALALPGVPAVYIHSLLGSRNWLDGVQRTGRARSINREQLEWSAIQEALSKSDSFRSWIFYPYLRMLQIRRNQPAFDPRASTRVRMFDPRVVAIEREREGQVIRALTNISADTVAVGAGDLEGPAHLLDLISGARVDRRSFNLIPYQTAWLVEQAF